MSQFHVTPYISNYAVLQRNECITIKGIAPVGAQIFAFLTSVLGESISKAEAIADECGQWKLFFQPLHAGGPYTIVVECDGEQKAYHDIYIGDVWLMSGQSNMQLPMQRVKYRFPKEYEEDGEPLVRQFTVPIEWNFKEEAKQLSGGKWESYSLKNAAYFSAVSYFFGRKLRDRYHVPIGLILTAVGGTPIEAWMSKNALSDFPDVIKLSDGCESEDDIKKVQMEDNERAILWGKELDQKDLGLTSDWQNSQMNFKKSSWKDINLSDDFWSNEDFRKSGSVWFKKKVIIPKELSGKPFRLSLGTIKDEDFTYVDGVCVGNITYRYPPREYHHEGLSEGEHDITIRAIAKTEQLLFTIGKKHELIFENGEVLSISEGWKYQRGVLMEELEPPVFFERKPYGMYQQMIAPLHDYPIRGMCWYQGEMNADDEQTYPSYFQHMIEDYRKKWKIGEFPVLYVQLPNYDLEDAGNWVPFRNMQQRLADLVNGAMVVTIDCGEFNDLHPTDKKTVGERLAMAAFQLAYHESEKWLSPVFRSADWNKDEVVLHFNHVESGFMGAEQELIRGFEVCISGEWFPVRSDIFIKNHTVIIRNEKDVVITGVRYVWSNQPVNANLRSRQGLPVSPFEVIRSEC